MHLEQYIHLVRETSVESIDRSNRASPRAEIGQSGEVTLRVSS
jgi:hypothetical protein